PGRSHDRRPAPDALVTFGFAASASRRKRSCPRSSYPGVMVHAPPRPGVRQRDGEQSAAVGPDAPSTAETAGLDAPGTAGRMARLLDWFGVDSDWERVPAGRDAYRKDLLLGAGFVVFAAISV